MAGLPECLSEVTDALVAHGAERVLTLGARPVGPDDHGWRGPREKLAVYALHPGKMP